MTGLKSFIPHTASQSETKGRLSFTLLKDGLFDGFDYKKLNSNLDKGFLECRHVYFNGKDKLSYKTEGLMPVSEWVGEISGEDFLRLMLSLFGALSGFDSIGHLDKSNIIYDPEYIFADGNFNAKLIYLPVKKPVQKAEAAALGSLYSKLKAYNGAYKNSDAERTAKFFKALAENRPPEDIEEITSAELIKASLGTREDGEKGKSKCVLCGIGKAHNIKHEFEGEGEYLIGRSPKKADFVIPADFKKISNLHCRITGSGGDWFLEDLNSTNGTKLNGEKLIPGSSAKIKDGDRIALADVEFVWKKLNALKQ